MLEARKSDPEGNLRSLIHPSKFAEVAAAARRVAGYQNGRYDIPSVALKLGYSLNQCAGILLSMSIIQGDVDLRKDAKDFMELYQREWKVEVSSRALGDLDERR